MNREAEEDMREDVEENPELYQALADSTMNKKDTEDFIEAAQKDEYAELELEPGFVLITDWEGDGSFEPYMVLPDGYEDEETLIESLDKLTHSFMDFDDLEIAEQNHLTFAHLYGAELLDIDNHPVSP